MPFGVDLSSAAEASLVQLMKRPTAAQRNQLAANDAAAARQESSQQFQARQREVDHQRQTHDANMARNERADAIFDRQQVATDMMERQHEQAMEIQRMRDATSLQRAALSRRKVTAQPGGPMQPVRPADATLVSEGTRLRYTTAGGLYREGSPDDQVNRVQIRPPTAGPAIPARFESEAARDAYATYQRTGDPIDQRAAESIVRKDALQPAALSKRLSRMYAEREKAYRQTTTDEADSPAAVAALAAQRAFLDKEIADIELLREHLEKPSSRLKITSIDAVPQPMQDAAYEYALDQDASTDEEFETAMRFFLNNQGYGNV